jgi:hypothetical protein
VSDEETKINNVDIQKSINVDIDHLQSLDPEIYKNLLYLKVGIAGFLRAIYMSDHAEKYIARKQRFEDGKIPLTIWLYHPLDVITNLKYKLLCFLTPKKISK